ncbi:hypothetical protein NKJ46_22880 [Mesorhizobium sp. M0166]
MGRILGIVRRIASFHLDNVREKLEVETINRAIAMLAVGSFASLTFRS